MTNTAHKDNEPTKVISFVNKITGNLPFVSKVFRIERFDEAIIAKWMGLNSRVAEKLIRFEDGNEIRINRQFVRGPDGFVTPWNAEYRDSPTYFSLFPAIVFDFSAVPMNVIRGGVLEELDRRTEIARLLLRMSRHGIVEPLNELFFRSVDTDRCTNHEVVHREQPTEDWSDWKADEQSLPILKRLIASLWEPLLNSYDGWPDDCLVAVRQFLRAQELPPPEREIALWIAMESILGPDDKQELSFRICAYGALFTEESSRRRGVYDILREGYRMRSKYVHGTEKPSKRSPNKPFEESYKEYCAIEDIARVALRRYLNCRLVHKMKREDIHQVLEHACVDSNVLATLPSDPGLAAVDLGLPGSNRPTNETT